MLKPSSGFSMESLPVQLQSKAIVYNNDAIISAVNMLKVSIIVSGKGAQSLTTDSAANFIKTTSAKVGQTFIISFYKNTSGDLTIKIRINKYDSYNVNHYVIIFY